MRKQFVEEHEPQPDIESGHRRILVLNRNWQAVNVIGMRRAFSILWQDHARVVNTINGEYIPKTISEWIEYSMQPRDLVEGVEYVRTIRMHLILPKIILLREYDRMPVSEVNFSRQSIFERDNYTCQYTGRMYRGKDLTLDHVIPRERGGQTSWENIVTCSRDVNERKANRLPHEVGLQLLRKPERPRWKPLVASIAAGSDIDDSWNTFLHVEKNAS